MTRELASDLVFSPLGLAVLFKDKINYKMFFDSFTPHRSSQNLTDGARRVLYVTYNRVSDGDRRHQYYRDKRVTMSPKVTQ